MSISSAATGVVQKLACTTELFSPTQVSYPELCPSILSVSGVFLLFILTGASIVVYKTCSKPVNSTLQRSIRTQPNQQGITPSVSETEFGSSQDRNGTGGNSSDSSNSSGNSNDMDADDRPPLDPGSSSPEPSDNNTGSESIRSDPYNQNCNFRSGGGSPPPPPPGSFAAFFEDNLQPASDWWLRILHILFVMLGIVAIWRSMPPPKNCVPLLFDLEDDDAALLSVVDSVEDFKPSESNGVTRTATPTLTQAIRMPTCTNTLPLPRPPARIQHTVPASAVTTLPPVDQTAQRRSKTIFTLLRTFGAFIAPLYILQVIYHLWTYYKTGKPVRIRIELLDIQLGAESDLKASSRSQGHSDPPPDSSVTQASPSIPMQTGPRTGSLSVGSIIVSYPTVKGPDQVNGPFESVLFGTDEGYVYLGAKRSDEDNIPYTCQSEPLPTRELDFSRLSSSLDSRRYSLGEEGRYNLQLNTPPDVLEVAEPISRSSSSSTWVPDPDVPPFVPKHKVLAESTAAVVDHAEPIAVDQLLPLDGNRGMGASLWAPSAPEEMTGEVLRGPSSAQGASSSIWASAAQPAPSVLTPAGQDVTVENQCVPSSAKGVSASIRAPSPDLEREEPQTIIDSILFEKTSSSNLHESRWAPQEKEALTPVSKVKSDASEGVGASMWAAVDVPGSTELKKIPPHYSDNRSIRTGRNRIKKGRHAISRAS